LKDIAIVYATFGDRAAAEGAAAQMVERHLAACANVQAPCLSVYVWEGKMERAEETPVIFKTSVGRREALMAALAAVHDYELPAISSWTAQTSAAFAQWVDDGTRNGIGAGPDSR
jgi:periplasmic divalent cation tolerance protein